jgi:hypothetical protein
MHLLKAAAVCSACLTEDASKFPGCRRNTPWIKTIFGWRLAKQVQLRYNEAK